MTRADWWAINSNDRPMSSLGLMRMNIVQRISETKNRIAAVIRGQSHDVTEMGCSQSGVNEDIDTIYGGTYSVNGDQLGSMGALSGQSVGFMFWKTLSEFLSTFITYFNTFYLKHMHARGRLK